MAQPRKLATANSGARAPVKGATKSATNGATNGASNAVATAAARGNGLRAALTVFALFCIVGVIPTALGGEAFGYWQLPISSEQLAAPPWALSYNTPLSHPTPMLANATLRVVTAPGGSNVVATMEPGFGVLVTRYATQAGARWAQIRWVGPTRASGGSGWALASDLIADTGAQSAQARFIGDLGALSPGFGQAASALGPNFASALYFPATGASYSTANSDQAQALGAQVTPLLLSALYAKGIVAAQPNASSGPPQIARDLAAGNAQALTFDYELVGDASGMDNFLTQRHVTGFQFAAKQPLQMKGTARSLALFYTALVGGQLVSAHDQAEILALLANANGAAATAVVPQTVIGSGALVVTTANGDGGVVSVAAGVLTPSSGPQVVVAAITQGSTPAATQKAMQTYFGSLIAIEQG